MRELQLVREATGKPIITMSLGASSVDETQIIKLNDDSIRAFFLNFEDTVNEIYVRHIIGRYKDQLLNLGIHENELDELVPDIIDTFADWIRSEDQEGTCLEAAKRVIKMHLKDNERVRPFDVTVTAECVKNVTVNALNSRDAVEKAALIYAADNENTDLSKITAKFSDDDEGDYWSEAYRVSKGGAINRIY